MVIMIMIMVMVAIMMNIDDDDVVDDDDHVNKERIQTDSAFHVWHGSHARFANQRGDPPQ